MPHDVPIDLYEDCLAWSERQADLLRRLARGERVNDQVDWSNVIEEVQDVGKSELRAVRSLLRRGIEHLLKVHGWPDGPVEHCPVEQWLSEARTFFSDANAEITPSMRSRLGIPDLYRKARALIAANTVNGRPPEFLPERCPFAVKDLIVKGDAPPEMGALLRKLDATAAGSTHAQTRG